MSHVRILIGILVSVVLVFLLVMQVVTNKGCKSGTVESKVDQGQSTINQSQNVASTQNSSSNASKLTPIVMDNHRDKDRIISALNDEIQNAWTVSNWSKFRSDYF